MTEYGFQEVVSSESIALIHHLSQMYARYKRFNVNPAEFACMKAIVLFKSGKPYSFFRRRFPQWSCLTIRYLFWFAFFLDSFSCYQIFFAFSFRIPSLWFSTFCPSATSVVYAELFSRGIPLLSMFWYLPFSFPMLYCIFALSLLLLCNSLDEVGHEKPHSFGKQGVI